ncbi:MAG: hypothetical protein C5B59_10795 [Bacteroidetes bacterium]|nr:MAG: hypothetical protein C5B59_10795 [Bacteroidota bacterium]
MSKLPGKIYNLQGLDYEIGRLQTKTRALEKEIDRKLDHLQSNYSSMFLKSFLPALGLKSGLIGTALDIVFRNRRLQNSFGKLTDQVFDKISDAVEFVANKLDGTKNAIEEDGTTQTKT